MGQTSTKHPKAAKDASGKTGLTSIAQSDAIVNYYHRQQQQQQREASHGLLPMCNANHSTSHSTPPYTQTYPVMLSYVDQGVKHLLEKKVDVFLEVELLDWKPIPMSPSTDSYFAIVELPPGCHNYRFLIHHTEVVDRTQPLAPMHKQRQTAALLHPAARASRGRNGSMQPVAPQDGKGANCVTLADASKAVRREESESEEEWGQEEFVFEESRKHPALLPLHLHYTPLNTPPTPFRCGADGKMLIVSEDMDMQPSPVHLPLPFSMTINRLYFQRRDTHVVMGITTRYRDKCSTIVYYSASTPLTSKRGPLADEEEDSVFHHYDL